MFIDWSFIEELEGFSNVGYVPPDAPGGNESGVTIGSGVDLGYWSVAQLRRRKVPEHIIDEVAPYLGVRGAAAREVADSLVLTHGDAHDLGACIRDGIFRALESRYDRATSGIKFTSLPERVRTVVVSVAFQYGPALSKVTPNFWRQVTTNDWVGAYFNLRNFGDSYSTRRNKEADYLAPALPERKLRRV